MFLHVDIETYSPVDIAKCGAYKYIEHPDFEIILVAWASDNNPIQSERVYGNQLPANLLELLNDPTVMVAAHNATFERKAFERIGVTVPLARWYCTSIKAGYCGLPLSLGEVSKALRLGESGKKDTGKALIRYFCVPCKPTKANGGRLRNMPEDNPQKWADFVDYCEADVMAEREICNRLKHIIIPDFERELYVADQQINDHGVGIDAEFVKGAIALMAEGTETLINEMARITGLTNPNSVSQLKDWINAQSELEIQSLNKKDIPEFLAKTDDATLKRVLHLRSMTSKSSLKKFDAMQACEMADGRARGLFQFYGASRTGRWAGRLIQLQNMTKNHIESHEDLATARELVRRGDALGLSLLYGEIPSILSQLTRTALVPRVGHRFVVVDFSAIEARVLAWLAGEAWRLEVFKGHGKIYEASASMMFSVPIEKVDKKLRALGKVAELALGYQGAVGALKTMGGEQMGLSEAEMESIVARWRAANPRIVALWAALEKAAVYVVTSKKSVKLQSCNVVFGWDAPTESLYMQLPSGRRLYYFEAGLYQNTWGKTAVRYRGVDQTTRQWGWQHTYGGKLAENLTQAVSRDIMADLIVRVNPLYPIAIHVHDEIVCEVPEAAGQFALNEILNKHIADSPEWANGLPLAGAGFTTPFYLKD